MVPALKYRGRQIHKEWGRERYTNNGSTYPRCLLLQKPHSALNVQLPNHRHIFKEGKHHESTLLYLICGCACGRGGT